MARKATNKLPTMGRHSSGQARVTLNGRVYYLGAFGTLEAQQRYTALVEQWVANGRRPLELAPHSDEVCSVNDLLRAYVAHLDATGRYRKNGVPTSARRLAEHALAEFAKRFGSLKLSKLAGAHLRLHIDDILTRPGLTRTGVNKKLSLIKTAFRWARERELLPRDRWLDVVDVLPLRKGTLGAEREAKRPKRAVTIAEADRVARAAPSPSIAGMVRVMARTGMRPGDARSMRWSDLGDLQTIDQVRCRIYTVQDAKTAHHGRSTSYLLPEPVLALLGAPSGQDAVVFPVPRTTRSYSTHGLRNAILGACEAAGVERFNPHELRHGYVTRACERHGVAMASALANHASVAVTSRYVHPDRTKADRAAINMSIVG